MSRRDWAYRGAFIPFPIPVVPPDDDPDGGTIVAACFNSAYLPYILGALKVLARQETWDGDDDTTNLACARFSTLLGMFGEGCILGETNQNWTLEMVERTSGDYSFGELPQTSPTNDRVFHGDFIANFEGVIDFTIRGTNPSGELLVGGKFKSFTVYGEPNNAVRIITVTTVSCTDETNTTTETTPYTITNQDLKSVRVISGNDISFISLTEGEWLCGPA